VSGAAIAAHGLCKRFGSVVALEGVDLALPGGGSLALLGPNGAGKSTLLRLLAGLTRPTQGTLRIDGQEAQGPAARGRVGYVAHATLLYPALTARENLLFAGRLHGLRDAGARADTLLREHGLADVAHRKAGGFSRGMGQRLSIARALVHDPSLVLLDEPFAGLDRRGSADLGARLARLRAEGRTLVLVTHEIGRAGELADHVVVLAAGRVVHRAEGAAVAAAPLEAAYLQAVESAA